MCGHSNILVGASSINCHLGTITYSSIEYVILMDETDWENLRETSRGIWLVKMVFVEALARYVGGGYVIDVIKRVYNDIYIWYDFNCETNGV